MNVSVKKIVDIFFVNVFKKCYTCPHSFLFDPVLRANRHDSYTIKVVPEAFPGLKCRTGPVIIFLIYIGAQYFFLGILTEYLIQPTS